MGLVRCIYHLHDMLIHKFLLLHANIQVTGNKDLPSRRTLSPRTKIINVSGNVF